MAGAPADLNEYANQFDELEVEERTPIVDLNAIHPLSELREDWSNVSNTPSEHHLSTQSDTDDTAWLQSVERGQYTAGYQVQAGTGVRIPTDPTGDSEIRWGYYEADENGDPLNGYYFGVDSDGVFVARVRGGVEERVYQDSWNRDKLDEQYDLNPSGLTLDLSDGQVFQIEFVYYGYGSIEMQALVDDDSTAQDSSSQVVTLHVFQPDNETSIENTNLPLRQEIESGGIDNDALDLFVGGRQFSIIGKRTTNSRKMAHFRDSISGVDNTKWYAAVSVKVKDGSDIGSIDFTHVLAEVGNFEVSNGQTPMRWQIRRGTEPDNPTWITPSEAEGDTDETAMKVDVSSADIQDGSGNTTGTHLDSGVLAADDNKVRNLEDADTEGRIANGDVVTFLLRAQPGEGSGTVESIHFSWKERW